MSTGRWLKVPNDSPLYVRSKVPHRFLLRQRSTLRSLREMVKAGSTAIEIDAAIAGALAELDALK